MRRRSFLLLLSITLSAAEPRASVTAVDSIGITVSDLDKAVDFYTRVLPFEKTSESETAGQAIENLQGVFGARIRTARLKLGSEFIELNQYLAPEGRPLPPDSRSNDRWFQHVAIIVSDMDAAYNHLRKHNVRHASTGPQKLPVWNKNAAGIEAFYFKDPDGHSLEILSFPPDKGNPMWHALKQQNPARIFLGIDHTAIVVSDTEQSLRFYRDTLGMQVAGESENYGTEQEHLNNVFGARLRITAVRAPNGPGVEFLEYLAPTDGRLYPQDSKSNDLWHWQTRFSVANADDAALSLRNSRNRFVSAGAVDLPGSNLGFRKAILVRDPDGHAVQIAEQ